MIGVCGGALTGRRRSSTVLAPDRMACAKRGRSDSSSVLWLVTGAGLPDRGRRTSRPTGAAVPAVVLHGVRARRRSCAGAAEDLFERLGVGESQGLDSAVAG